MKYLFLLLFASFMLALPTVLDAQCPANNILYVNAGATSGANDGTSWTDAFTSLQDAIALKNSCPNIDQIWVAAGTYKPSAYPADCIGCTTDRDFTFLLPDGLSLYGGFAGTELALSERDIANNTTILSGDIGIIGDASDNVYHVVSIVFPISDIATNIQLDGFTITGGNANGGNTHTTVNGGKSWRNVGGGILLYGGDSYGTNSANTLANNTLYGNTASFLGGAISIFYNANTLVNNTLFGNSSNHGGGIYITGINILLNNTLSENTAIWGGGIYTEASVSTFVNNTLSGNMAVEGGGIFCEISSNTLVNNTLSGNTAGEGGGIYFYTSTDVLTNNIIWGNSDGIFTESSTLNVSHSIVQGGWSGTTNLDEDPLFIQQPPVGLGSSGDLRLQSNSPAIDAGNNAAVPLNVTTDLDDNPRISNLTVDMGAYEFQAPIPPGPSPVCATDLTVQIGADGIATVTADAVGNNSTGYAPLSLLIDGQNSLIFGCSDVGMQSVVLQVTDPFMSMASTTCTFTIEDSSPPTALCQNATVQLDTDGNGTTTATALNAGSTDNCDITSISAGQTAFGCGDVGANTVILTVTDVNGNSSDCNATVTVEDNTPPTANCPSTQIVSSTTGQCGANVSFSIPDPTDNCSATATASSASGSFFNVGTTQITVTATDGTGNTGQCTFDVIVNDTENPTISCPADVTQTVDAGQTYATVINIAPVSSDDNCASPTITHAISGATTGSGGADASNTQFNIGSSVVTYTVTDAAGLIGNCSFTVDVTPDCGSILVNSTADNLTPGDGNCTLREAIRNVNAGSDLTSGDCNCGNTITFDVSTNGTPIVLSIAGTDEDAAATGDLDITADVTITGNGSGNTIINGNDIDRVFHLPPAAASLNVTLEHLTVKDGLLTGSNFGGGGLNSDSNNANLIISNCAFESNQASSNGGGLRIESASTVEIDNCLFNGNIAYESYGGGVSLSIGAYTIRNCFFQNNQAGVAGGGAATHSGVYTFINCTMTGNTATNGGGAIENSSNSGSVTLTNCTIAENTSINGAAVDINNNNAFLSLTNNIIVNNISSSDLKIIGVSPQVNVKNIVESCSGSCPTFFSTSDDVICGLSTCANGLSYYPVIPNSDADGTADTSTPLADDICGNSRSTSSYNIGSSEVFFTDNENPVAICPATQTVSNDAGECGANVSFTVPDPTDNCSATSSASPASGSFFNVGTTQVTVTATDGTGNTSQCTFDVIVNDTENPSISCPADVTQTVDADQTYATVIDIAPASSDDNCASPTITHAISGVTTSSGGSDASGTQFNIGSSVVTYTIEDASNNTATCSFNVEVNGNAEIDVQDPDMNSLTNNASNYDFGNVDIMGGSASGTFTINNIGDIALLLDGAPTVAISGSASFSVTQPSSTTIAPAGATAFQIDYNPANEDCSQQMATVSIENNDPDENPFVFTVSATPVDNVNPTANCPSNITQSNDTGQCGANVSFSIPAPSDNCPGVSAIASPASGSFFNVGTTSVTVIATDASNNTGSCTFTVTVTDNEDPGITCPADITVDNDLGLCSAVVNIPNPTVSDNCPGASFEYAPASGSAFDVGTTTVTAT
ncbi:MAG: HYR domain-containing protein, partial [Phaeodactylibacter sp.]|uniref:HYR domain-containing protein n=1 Tax=Phaeodactylibacter sp. TaxID=1940289 RepID=UPI0032F00F99